MAFEVSSNGSNGRITVSSEASDKPGGARRAAPIQSFNDLADMRIALARNVRVESVSALNLILADTITLRDLYKKHPRRAGCASPAQETEPVPEEWTVRRGKIRLWSCHNDRRLKIPRRVGGVLLELARGRNRHP